MPYPGNKNPFKRSRLRTPIRIAVDTTFTPPATGAKAGEIWAGEMVWLSPNGKAVSLSIAQTAIATTSTTSVTAVNGAGTAVTPTSMLNIFVGSALVVDTVASGKQETVIVTAVTATTFTATFTKTHATGFPITDRQINLQSTTSITGGGFGIAGAGTALTVGALANNFTVGEFVSIVSSAAGKEILETAPVTAKTGTTITIATQGTYTQPFEIITTPVNTVGNTNVGSQTITVANGTGIAVGQSLLIDTVGSGVQETVVVTAVAGANVTANFLNAHTQPYPVVNAITDTNAANFIGVSMDNSYVQIKPKEGVGGRGADEPLSTAGVQYIQIMEEGDFEFNTTVGDTYNPYDLVYVGADGATVQKTANGRAIGRVSPDQQSTAFGQTNFSLGTAIAGAAGQKVVVRINTALL